MRIFIIILGIISLLFSIPTFIDPLIYWEYEKLNLWIRGIKGAKPSKFHLLLIRVLAFGGILFGLFLILSGIFGNVE